MEDPSMFKLHDWVWFWQDRFWEANTGHQTRNKTLGKITAIRRRWPPEDSLIYLESAVGPVEFKGYSNLHPLSEAEAMQMMLES